MKRIFCAVMALLMLFTLTGCGEFHQGVINTRPNQDRPSGPVDVNDKDAYTVTLYKDGARYIPSLDPTLNGKELYAQWTDGYSYYTAKFDDNGVASITGLDGDYTVTLSDVPMDYTYNTNGYQVSSDDRNIDVEIYRTYYGEGEGTGLYYPEIKSMSTYGVYEITINGPDDVVYCRFLPYEKGIYNIESWVSIAEDNINPKMDLYYGSAAYLLFQETIDGGGRESKTGFTKNFKYEYVIVAEEVGNQCTFGVKATAKDGQYPVTVQVVIERVGDPPEKYFRELVVPQEVIRFAPNMVYATGQYDAEGNPAMAPMDFIWAENGGTIFDQKMYKLWKVENGGDGFYHLYDEEKYAATDGYGPTLYAKITQSTRWCAALNVVEYQGNGNSYLSLKSDATNFKNYKHFIEGYKALAEIRLLDSSTGAIGSFYCSGTCKECHPNMAVGIYAGCKEGCTKCEETCRLVPEALYGAPGYADGCNNDGCYPVTEELKTMMQMYATAQAFFVDGNGVVETDEDYPMDSDEESQWLAFCGYYAQDPGGKCQMGAEVPNFYD